MAITPQESSANEYLPRIADEMLESALRAAGAVYIKGPKWCGKTMTAIQHTKSQVFMQDPDHGPSLKELAQAKPSAILEGDEPRLIDEWQEGPALWDAVRFAVDRKHGKGRFVLTGSATPKEAPRHSGVGRIKPLHMRTMSLYETGESTGEVSLAKLFNGEAEPASISKFDIEDIAFAICRGGWPEAVTEENREIALQQAVDYIAELLDRDIYVVDERRRNETWMRGIMRSYARNISTEASMATIAADMGTNAPSNVTLSEYIDVLERACVTEDLPAWNPKLRSKTAVRTSPTRHFSDVSIAAAMLGATPEKLLSDFETFGLLFESLCIHDLRIYAESFGGSVAHYRDKTGLEADAVITLPDGSWAPVEVKLGEKHVEEAAKHLKKLADRVNKDVEGKPSFLLVVTGSQTAYRRKDGVIVAPLATLAP